MIARRNALLASERFRNCALSLPLVNRIASKNARQLFDLTAGFVYSQILYACVELDLFKFLQQQPRSITEVVKYCGMPRSSAQRLLDAARALDLVTQLNDGHYTSGRHGAVLAGNRAISSMILHHRHLYADLADPVALLRAPEKATALSEFWRYADAVDPCIITDQDVESYSALMSSSQSLIAHVVLDAYNFGQHESLLDVGGGDGTFLRELKRRHRHIRASLFDLPGVIKLAKQKSTEDIEESELSFFAGDFFKDDLPPGHDIICLNRILHDHNDASVHMLLRNIKRALPAGGTLLIAEPLVDHGKNRRIGDAYFGIYLLDMGQGQPRSYDRLVQQLTAAGFQDIVNIATPAPFQSSLVQARS